jgi:hypothetical protein
VRSDRFRRPSPALVVALIALFFALGGTGYAVSRLPKNSVTSAQVKDYSLLKRDFKRGQLPRGPRGLQGLEGLKGDKGDKGDQGAAGDPWTLNNGQFPSGKTLRGVFAPGGTAAATGSLAQEGISFGFTLTAFPVTHYIPTGSAAPPECPGTVNMPQAQPGHLCVYENHVENVLTRCIFNPVSNACDASAIRGFGVAIFSAAPGDFVAQGSWAVTAP